MLKGSDTVSDRAQGLALLRAIHDGPKEPNQISRLVKSLRFLNLHSS